MLTFIIRLICVLSWTTVLFIPKEAVKRYLPVTMLSGLFTVTVIFIGTFYNFWGEKGRSRQKMWNHLLFALGPFAVMNMWIFYLTYGRFKLYLLTNLINNLMYSFGMISIMEKVNYINYVKFTKIHHLIVTMVESLILYTYHQLLFDKTRATQSRILFRKILTKLN